MRQFVFKRFDGTDGRTRQFVLWAIHERIPMVFKIQKMTYITSNEFKKNVGIILLITYTVSKTSKDNWSNDPLKENHIVSKLMTTNQEIKR